MGELKRLSDRSGLAVHADVVSQCERLLERAKAGEVNEVFLIYTTDGGETLKHLSAGANHFRFYYMVSRVAQYLLEMVD